MRTACILLSTYNGARFLDVQIRSLLQQRGCDVSILVRDDGSTDGTLALLQQYAQLDPRISVIAGANVGVVQSFFQLLQQAPEGRDGYFFCDQDDYWHEDKVGAALEALSSCAGGGPLLYCSRLRYVDERGQLLGLSPHSSCVGLPNALVENVAIGCTMALNGPARAAIQRALPTSAIMHDWWCYLVVSSIGEVIYDPTPRIDYRQHSSNTVGAGVTQAQIWVRRIRQRLKRSRGAVTRAERQRCCYACIRTR